VFAIRIHCALCPLPSRLAGKWPRGVTKALSIFVRAPVLARAAERC
jgi:hypothetical protein